MNIGRLSVATLKRIPSGGAILCFHGIVAAAAPTYSPIHVSIGLFESLLPAIQLAGAIVPLRDLVARQLAGQSTAGCISLTFDDAYATLCQPLFATFVRRQIPFTVFAVTDALSRGGRFWWDRLEELHARAPDARWLDLGVGWGLPARALTRSRRLESFRNLILHGHQGRMPDRLAAQIQQLEGEFHSANGLRSATETELEQLARLPWVSIGVHTRSHPLLPALSDAEVVSEVREAYAALRTRFAGVDPILAVPYGLFDRRTLDLARVAGMRASLTLEGRTLDRGYEAGLPRFCVMRTDKRWKLLGKITGLQERLHCLRRRDPAVAHAPGVGVP